MPCVARAPALRPRDRGAAFYKAAAARIQSRGEVSVLLLATGALWLAAAGLALRAALSLRRLPPAGAAPPPEAPLVSVVLAARDEAARLETTLRQLAAQRGVRLEIVVVDDRSRDETPALLRRLGAELPGLRPQRVDALPPGWVGKCHAQHVGSRLARGEWLLFSDGDIWLGPDVVARALRQALAEGVDHLALTPHLRPPHGEAGFVYQACLLPLALAMTVMSDLVNRDHPRAFVGIGAFNLIRRARYDAIGGHEPLRMEVVDDMKLGALVRRGGGRTRVYIGDDDVQCDWAADVPAIVRALEKNSFASAEFRLGLVVGATLLVGAGYLLALLGPWLDGAAGLFVLAGFASLGVAGVFHARLHRYSSAAGALLPLMVPFGWLVLWNSMLVTLRQGGIRWRDTFYPLAELRRGLVPRP
jgi:glycosyltransferase involved in cell wall biosynthesis